MTTENQMQMMSPEQLRERIRVTEREWSRAAERANRAEKLITEHNSDPKRQGRGIPPKPKKRGQVDKVSVKQATQDVKKSSLGGMVTIILAAGKYLLDWYRESGGNPVELAEYAGKLGPIIWIVFGLVAGHFLIVLAAKSLQEYK